MTILAHRLAHPLSKSYSLEDIPIEVITEGDHKMSKRSATLLPTNDLVREADSVLRDHFVKIYPKAHREIDKNGKYLHGDAQQSHNKYL